jgi:hypothetical protein
MVEHLTGRQLRTVAWLVLLGKKHGAQVLDEPQRFDELIGAGQFAVLDGEDLDSLVVTSKRVRRARVSGPERSRLASKYCRTRTNAWRSMRPFANRRNFTPSYSR